MSNLPTALIVTDAAKAHAETVLSLYRAAPIEFGRKVIPVDTVDPTPASPPTHWMLFDASSDSDHVTVYHGFAAGDLPPLPDGVVWGVDGVISAGDAMAAISGVNLQVYSVSGEVVPGDFAAGVLASRGLMLVPEPEF